MKQRERLKSISFFCLILVCVLIGCSGSKQAFKKAKEYEEAGLYVEAAEYDLSALRQNPGFKEAKKHLQKVAPKAYGEIMDRITNLQKAENWDQAVTEYRALDDLLERCHANGVVFETTNVKEELKAAERRAAQHHFDEAEQLSAARSWTAAAQAYVKAHQYIDNFNLSFDKAVSAYQKAGEAALKAQNYEEALSLFGAALEVAPDHGELKKSMSIAHLGYGRQLFDAGSFREALVAFEAAEALDADSQEIKNWADRAYKQAVQYVAIFPFANRTRLEIDVEQLASDLLTLSQRHNLPFVEFMQHPTMLSLLGGTSFRIYGRDSEADLRQVAVDEGLDSFVWGRVLDIDVTDSPEKMKERSREIVVKTEKDSSGKEIEIKETIYYREYTLQRDLRIAIEQVIIEPETGTVLDRQRFTETHSDLARWVAYQGSIYDLPPDVRPLLDAPRTPKPVPVMINETLARLAEKLSQEVVQFYR